MIKSIFFSFLCRSMEISFVSLKLKRYSTEKPCGQGDLFLSTFIENPDKTILTSEDMLKDYFAKHAKCGTCIFVGMEAELLGVNQGTGQALPYFGPQGIETILKAMAAKFNYTPLLEEGRIIALRRADAMVTLEPGGQIELSAPPADNVFQVEAQVQNFLGELRQMRTLFDGIEWLACGIQPYSLPHEMEQVPKVRYAIMAEHFKTHGTLSHEMMKLTATNQVNFDYLDEADAMESLRVAFGITSIVTAMFANSAFSGGGPNGFASRRLEIWNHTDADRSGLLMPFLEAGRTFQDYLNYVLDMPMLFIVREGRWIPLKNRSFRSFIKTGFEGFKATLEDFEMHLSAAFPEVRLKQYLEVRGVDGQKPALIPAVAAFWKGLLYQKEAKREAWKLVEFATLDERQALHRDVARLGLKAKLGTKPIVDLARELVDLSCSSLASQTTAEESRSECVFLNRIREEIIIPGKSPAEQFVDWFDETRPERPADILEYFKI